MFTGENISQEALPEKQTDKEQETIDKFVRNLRNTIMRLEGIATYCSDETNDTNDENKDENKRVKSQLENIQSDFSLLNDQLKKMCYKESKSYDSPTYFEAYNKRFLKPRLEDLKLDDKAEKELGVIVYDLRQVVSGIYPLDEEDSIFFGLDEWEKKNLKVNSYEEFCKTVEGRIYGQLPLQVYEGTREVDEDKEYFDFDDSPAAT